MRDEPDPHPWHQVRSRQTGDRARLHRTVLLGAALLASLGAILRRLLVIESPAREGAQSADLAGDARPRFGDADRPTYRRDRLETSIATAISAIPARMVASAD
jgi:hypothetical protein